MNFEERIEQNLDGLNCVSPGICCRCEQCQSDYGMTEKEIADGCESGELCDEGGYSMQDCESCGTDLAGDRYAAHGIGAKDELIHLDICGDCFLYFANGERPLTPWSDNYEN